MSRIAINFSGSHFQIKSELRLIGYWRSQEDPHWPDPAGFVDKDWDRTLRRKLIQYLQAGQPVTYWRGLSWCRFQCGDTAMGCAEQTDGVYIWPEGLAHYLERHSVRLPDAFVKHALQRGQPGKIVLLGVPKVNTQWWQEQKGWTEGESFDTERPGVLHGPHAPTLSTESTG